MRVQHVLVRHDLEQLQLDLERVLPGARPVRLPMRKICVSTAMVGSPNAMLSTTLAVLRPTPGSASSASRVRGTCPPCSATSFLRQRDDVLRLGAIEPDGLDQFAHALFAERRHLLRRVGRREQRRRRLVDAGVGRLRRQHHRDQQRERIDVLQLALRLRHRRPGSGGTLPRPRPCVQRHRAVRGFAVGLGLRFGGLTLAALPWPRFFDRLHRGLLELPGRASCAMIAHILSSMTARQRRHAPPNPRCFPRCMTPHRSLGATGFVIVMAAGRRRELRRRHRVPPAGRLAGVRLFRPRRAADLLAFRANYRAASGLRGGDGDALRAAVRKVSHRGEVAEWTLNPVWVRLEREIHEEFGIERLLLVSRGRKLPIAGFLGARGEGKLRARRFRPALGEAKRGPTRTAYFSWSEIGWAAAAPAGLESGAT